MKIGITGSNGFVAGGLIPALRNDGHEVLRFVRTATDSSDAVRWDPVGGTIDRESVGVCDAIIHLGGSPVGVRWNDRRKRIMRVSRVDSTALLSRTIAEGPGKTRVFIVASAVGYYGDRGAEVLDESAPRGDGFLAELVEAWEDAAAPARKAGVRVVHLRTGVVLGSGGGAIKQMLIPFKLGVGGRLGSGCQYLPWIHMEDTVGAIRHVMDAEDVQGPVNVVAPHPVTNTVFTRALGKALVRPTLVPVPAFGLRMLFGEMAGEVLLASQRVVPGTLLDSRYRFQHSEIGTALGSIFSRNIA